MKPILKHCWEEFVFFGCVVLLPTYMAYVWLRARVKGEQAEPGNELEDK